MRRSCRLTQSARTACLQRLPHLAQRRPQGSRLRPGRRAQVLYKKPRKSITLLHRPITCCSAFPVIELGIVLTRISYVASPSYVYPVELFERASRTRALTLRAGPYQAKRTTRARRRPSHRLAGSPSYTPTTSEGANRVLVSCFRCFSFADEAVAALHVAACHAFHRRTAVAIAAGSRSSSGGRTCTRCEETLRFSPPFLVLPPEARVFLRQEEAIPSNYYPISASAFIRDEAATARSGAQARQLTLLTDRGHGESCRSPVLPLPFLHFLDPPSHCASTAVLR